MEYSLIDPVPVLYKIRRKLDITGHGGVLQEYNGLRYWTFFTGMGSTLDNVTYSQRKEFIS